MYLRTTSRNNKNGSTTEYVQLAHNVWDKVSKRSTVKVLLNFGRKDELDFHSLERLVASIQKFIGSSVPEHLSPESVRILSAKPIGGTWFLDQLWNRLGIDKCLAQFLSLREYSAPIERALFAMVANRALDPASKLSVEHWVKDEVFVPGLPEAPVHQLYRAMDFLLEHDVKLQEDIFFSVANLMNLEVDLIYFDTTSTYFETEYSDDFEDTTSKDKALRQRGHSKDHRDDLPQIVIGMAVTKQGIPVRCWVFSGETADVSIVKQVKQDLNGWRLGRVISVMDRGFASEDNFVTLQSGGGHYIMGEKMRSGQREVVAALAKAGRFKQLGADLYAKESVVGEGERRVRYVIVLNPQEAEKDKALRQRHLEVLQKKLAALGNLEGKAHTKAVCALVSHRTYGRYLRTRGNGRLEINSAVIRAEEKLDGKYLLRTSDDTLSVEDIVLGYKQLLIIERGFRTLKTDLELRPVYHRKSGRIKAHVLICWLALLLLRVAELETDQSWFHVARALKKLSLVAMQIPEGVVHQTSTPTAEHKRLYARCHLNLPPEVVRVDV